MELNPAQMLGLHKMGWSGLHYKCGAKVLPLVEGVKSPPGQLLEKSAESLGSLYPKSVIQAASRDVAGLMETCGKQDESAAYMEAVDWQGCTALHHAIVHSVGRGNDDQVLGTLLYHKADCAKQNRRAFTPMEVAALVNPGALSVLLSHYVNANAASKGGAKREDDEDEEKKKVLRKLQKTLESSVQHVKHELVKRNATVSIKIIADFTKTLLV